VGYVIGAYSFAWLTILGYGISLYVRFRRERAMQRPAEEERE